MAGQEQRDNGLGQADGSEKEVEILDENFQHLDFAVHRSRRYHEKLSQFYGLWRDRFRTVTVLAGSGAFFIVFAHLQHLAELLTGFVGLWAILDLVIRPDKKYDLHSELRARFTDLARKIRHAKHTKEELADLEAQRLEIETDEPPCKRLVDLEARNDEIRGRGWDLKQIAPLTASQRRWGAYATFGMKRLEDWKAGIAPIPHRARRVVTKCLSALAIFGLGVAACYAIMDHRETILRTISGVVDALARHK